MKFLKPPGGPTIFLVTNTSILMLFLLVLFGSQMGENYVSIAISLYASLFLLFLIYKHGLSFPKLSIITFLLFGVVLITTTFASKVFELSISETLFYAGLLLTSMLAFQITFSDKKIFEWVILKIVVLGIAVSILYLIKESLTKNFGLGAQFAGPFQWHNQMAGFLSFLLPLSTVYGFLDKKHRIFWWGSSFALLVGLVFTYSRGGWISIISSSIIVLGFVFWKKISLRKIIPLLIAGIITTILLVTIPQSQKLENRVKSIATEMTSSRSVSGQLRVTASSVALDILKDNPVTGSGPGTYGEAYYQYQKEPWLYARHTHNHYLQIASEMGWLGFISFLALIASVVYLLAKGVNTSAKDKKTLYLLTATYIGLLSAIIHNIVDVDWNVGGLAFMFWFLAGMSLGVVVKKEDLVVLTGKPKALLSVFLSLTAIVSLWYFSFFTKIEAGKNLYLDGEYQKSYDTFSTARNLIPNSYSPYVYLGILDSSRNEWSSSRNNFEKSQRGNPYNAELLFQQAVMEKSIGNNPSELLRKAVDLNPYAEPKYYMELANELGEKDAKDLLREAVEERFPPNESYQGFRYLYRATGMNKTLAEMSLAYAKLISKDKEEAIQKIESALKNFDSENESLKNLIK